MRSGYHKKGWGAFRCGKGFIVARAELNGDLREPQELDSDKVMTWSEACDRVEALVALFAGREVKKRRGALDQINRKYADDGSATKVRIVRPPVSASDLIAAFLFDLVLVTVGVAMVQFALRAHGILIHYWPTVVGCFGIRSVFPIVRGKR